MAANDVPCCEPMFWAYLVTCAALVAFAGLMSGLTLGLLSLSEVELEILSMSGPPQDRKNAEKILPLVKNKHLLLCTLLIGNAAAMEALPIFIDSLMPAWSSILISVTLILAFGEIIPQAVCSRYGLSVGAKTSIIVRLILLVLLPLSYPISKLLDWILGKKHSALLRRAELKTLVVMHGNESGRGGELTHEETTIIAGALDLTQKTVKDAMTPISTIFALDINSKLDEKTMELMIKRGHSRVPIYSGSPTNIVGFILVKNLIKCSPEDGTHIRDLTIRTIPRVNDGLPLYEMMNQFLKIHSHMAVVVKCKNNVNKTEEFDSAGTGVFKININSNSRQEDMKGIVHPNFGQKEHLISSTSLSSSRNELWKEGVEHLPLEDDEAIGIITLEDVMEELLQEEIVDETDEYIDVHKKLKINMLTSPRLKSVSSSRIASPVDPHRHSSTPRSSFTASSTPVALYSPVSPYSHSPIARPTLCTSPGKYVLRSPASFAGAAYY